MKPATSRKLSSSKQTVLIAAVLIGAGVYALAREDEAPAAAAVSPTQAEPGQPQRAGSPLDDTYAGDALPPGHPPIGPETMPASDMRELPPGHPPVDGPMPTGAAPTDGPVAPLPDGLTVAKVYADAPALAGKRVKLAVRVVKSTPNVLGRTWLHVQDGSGDEKKGDHDLVVTTESTPAVGDVIEIEGVVARDRDLGSGYRYAVLLEDATIRSRPVD